MDRSLMQDFSDLDELARRRGKSRC